MNRFPKIRFFPEPKPFENIKRDEKFYHSPAWRKVRKWYILRNPLCEECERQGKITSGSLVDHIIPINNKDAYDTKGHGEPLKGSNLQTLCKRCHSTKTGKSKR